MDTTAVTCLNNWYKCSRDDKNCALKFVHRSVLLPFTTHQVRSYAIDFVSITFFVAALALSLFLKEYYFSAILSYQPLLCCFVWNLQIPQTSPVTAFQIVDPSMFDQRSLKTLQTIEGARDASYPERTENAREDRKCYESSPRKRSWMNRLFSGNNLVNRERKSLRRLWTKEHCLEMPNFPSTLQCWSGRQLNVLVYVIDPVVIFTSEKIGNEVDLVQWQDVTKTTINCYMSLKQT